MVGRVLAPTEALSYFLTVHLGECMCNHLQPLWVRLS